MTESFDRALAFVLAHEGGLSDDPDDPGGITNLGISLRFLKGLPGLAGDIDHDGDVDADDIRALTPETAAKFYYDRFWEPCNCHNLAWPVSLVMFDSAVNCGPGRAKRWLQGAINTCTFQTGHGPQIEIDGRIGPRTMRAYTYYEPRQIAGAMLGMRLSFYHFLIIEHPKLKKYIHGWENRVRDCHEEARR